MKKVKITVLKTTLDKELALEYGTENFTACPMFKSGQNLIIFVMKHGNLFLTMPLHLLMAEEIKASFMMIG